MKHALLLVFLTGCGIHDIVVVDLPPSDGGMMMGPQMKNCSSTDKCMHPNEFCELDGCASTFGKCRMRPSFCPPDFSPVCGCNGVTYWNDCIRKGSGQPASTTGQCGEPATCGNGVLCPDNAASCAKLLLQSSSCSTAVTGACWVVPQTCPPPVAKDDAWETCGAGPLVCEGLCTAVRSEQVRRKVDLCP